MTITFEECDFSVILDLLKCQNLSKMKIRISKSEGNRNRASKEQEKRMKKSGRYLCMLYIPSVFLCKCVYIFFRTFLFEENNDDDNDEKKNLRKLEERSMTSESLSIFCSNLQ